jgi:hypothetical protein
MPGHGNHWCALYGDDADIEAIIVRDLEDSTLVDSFLCVDVAHGTERAEEVSCLRWGQGSVVEDTLVVTDSTQQERFLFSAYPVIREGTQHTVTVDEVDPWEYGVEAWVHVRVTAEEIPLVFFDVRYYAGSECLQPGQKIDVSLAGLAYSLEPLKQTSFEIGEGPFWEMQKQSRLDEGKSLEEAEQPVTIHLNGMAALLPGSGECCDEAEFHGVIEVITHFEHDGKTIYRLEIVLLRPGDDVFKLPVFVSEVVLNGYVPRLGEDVQGVMWIQGYLVGAFGDGA